MSQRRTLGLWARALWTWETSKSQYRWITQSLKPFLLTLNQSTSRPLLLRREASSNKTKEASSLQVSSCQTLLWCSSSSNNRCTTPQVPSGDLPLKCSSHRDSSQHQCSWISSNSNNRTSSSSSTIYRVTTLPPSFTDHKTTTLFMLV